MSAKTYDKANQLTQAFHGDGRTEVYTYDTAGNILTFNNGSGIHRYTYGNSAWGDLLQYYDGQEIVYDRMGNPTSYYNGTRWTFTWAEGRNLVNATGGGHSVSYTYDHNGVRTTKTVDGVLHTYTYASGKLLREVYGTTVLDFFYDANGTPVSMRQSYTNSNNYTVYYYITNLQGDVIRLVDLNGNTAAYYNYDPYGRVIEASGSHANINPLRYRGYYYDVETGLYYLQSRYYDPQVGRFINADSYASTGQGIIGNNMFAYCLNDPVNMVDPCGRVPILLPLIIIPAIPIIVGIVSNHIENAENEQKIDEEIKDSYSEDEAKEEIEDILSDYDDDITVTFNDDNVQINNSHNVDSKYDRQKVSAIISRTENYTDRDVGNLSAEWNAHNAMFFIPWWTEPCRNVNLDYAGDPRVIVQAATAVFEFFGWE